MICHSVYSNDEFKFKKIFKSKISKTKLLKYFRFSHNDVSTNFDDFIDIMYLFKPVLYRQVNIGVDNYELINALNEHKELTKLLIIEFTQKYNYYLSFKYYT